MSGTQDRIRMINVQISKLRTIEKHYQSSLQELEETKKEFEKVENSLHNEYTDIESLEKFTLKGVFHSILGDKKKQLEKARQEYLQVALKHNELKTTMQTLEYEIDLLKSKSDRLKDLESELQSLMKIREDELKLEASPQGEQIRLILGQIDQLVQQSNRLEEVKNAGKVALKKLNMAILALQEARNWGNWDMMRKNSRMTDFYKHGAIDDAKQLAFDAKRALIHFERELDDIGVEWTTRDFELDSMSSFLDVFFDNLITDWIFQQKIKKTLATLNQIENDLTAVLDDIKSEQANNEKELTALLDSKERILSS